MFLHSGHICIYLVKLRTFRLPFFVKDPNHLNYLLSKLWYFFINFMKWYRKLNIKYQKQHQILLPIIKFIVLFLPSHSQFVFDLNVWITLWYIRNYSVIFLIKTSMLIVDAAMQRHVFTVGVQITQFIIWLAFEFDPWLISWWHMILQLIP